jgi:serine protease Do
MLESIAHLRKFHLSKTGTRLSKLWLGIVVLIAAQIWCGSAAQGQDSHLRGLRELQDAFRSVVKSVKPAVVNVSTVRIVSERQVGPGLDPFFENHPFREFFGDEFFRRFFGPQGGTRQSRQQGLGSGFIFDSRGYIFTSRHVIEGADEITVTLESKQKYKARLIHADRRTDVAIIKIDAKNLPVAQLGDPQAVQVGDLVLAIGNPLGLTQTVTQGIVSAKGRSDLGVLDVEDFIQTDAAINVGNSGGPLVNLDGRVIGMNTLIVSRSGGNMGIGMAIPANLLQQVRTAALSKAPMAQGQQRKGPSDVGPSRNGQRGPESLSGPHQVPRLNTGRDI